MARTAPEINAGSMADVAFLLLIFFLVTTTIKSDSGINRQLPQITPPLEDPPPIKKKNIFIVVINKNNQLLVEEQLMQISELQEAAVAFLDNGGENCSYCQGAGLATSSDNPRKAVISVQTSRMTDYGTYITVQNELVAAYQELRNRAANRIYGVSFETMERQYSSPDYGGDKEELEKKIKRIQEMWPLKISEAETKTN